MPALGVDHEIKIFTTCPVAATGDPSAARGRLRDVARWSEEAGCEGILVFSDNKQLDPWLVSEVILESTERLCPLVAVQPAYMHPYTVAKMLASFAFLHARRLYLNMVAGGFKNDLLALNDPTPHDERYARLIEYTRIIQRLVRGTAPVDFSGRYYQVSNLKLTPRVPPEFLPGVLVSGSSEAGREAADQLGATAVEYPQPSTEYAGAAPPQAGSRGIRIGVIARGRDEQAWTVARERYPEDRKGQLTHELAMKVSDSRWHRQLSELDEAQSDDSPYWLVPFRNYKAMCPYLVGSYERVADEITGYVAAGYSTFILDEPAGAAEMEHVAAVFERVSKRCAAA